jgi:hypothetical protein
MCHLTTCELALNRLLGSWSTRTAVLNWPSDIHFHSGASYHRDPTEYLRDFAREYASYHWGTHALPTYRSTWVLADLESVDVPADRLEPSRKRIAKAAGAESAGGVSVHSGVNALFKFCEELTPASIGALLSLPRNTVIDALKALTIDHAIVVHDLEEDGFAITKFPWKYSALWPAYAALCKLLVG